MLSNSKESSANQKRSKFLLSLADQCTKLSGNRRSVEQVRGSWKYKSGIAKEKWAKIYDDFNGTGGGPSSGVELTPEDEEYLEIYGKKNPGIIGM